MTTAQDWDRYWSGRGQAGEAFLGEGVERHPVLEEHWRALIEAAPVGPVLDIAAGAGSVAKQAAALGRKTSAADISPQAMDVLASAVPEITCATASAEQLPFGDGAFGLVCSQFGIEYAPDEAFAEALRVLQAGGQFAFVIHIEGGAIEMEVRSHRRSAERLLDAGLFEAATNLGKAVYTGSFSAEKAAYDAAEAMALQSGSPIAAHTAQGFRQLANRFQAYAPQDIEGWLAGMRAEAEAYLGRMRSMEAAAKSEAEIKAIADVMRGAGAKDVVVGHLHLAAGEKPAAWRLEGRKRG